MTALGTAPGCWRRHVDFYRAVAAIELKSALQYRLPTLLGMVALMCEPIVYLVVWTTVAADSGGTVGGLTQGQVSAYYVVWTLARNLTAGIAPDVWQVRFRDGTLADLLLRPVHPVHGDLAAGLGGNVPRMVMSLPITVVLVIAFRPSFDIGPATVAVFVVSIVAAFVVRGLLFCLVGTIGFWTTRVEAARRLFMAIELLMSGRLVPVVLLPGWLAVTAEWLPFRYAFGFSIEVVTTGTSGLDITLGVLTQFGWVAALAALLGFIWRRAVRHFDSVGI